MADTSVKVSFIGDSKKLSKTLNDVDDDMEKLGKNSKSFGDKFTGALSKTVPVLAGVGAGVAVLGSALKAAAEDEAEQKKLATTIMNVAEATAADVEATEKWIDARQRATGIADSEMRPALDALLRGTGSLDTSTELLTLAMDIATGTGKNLTDVAYALSAAYTGNMRGLQSLSPEMKTMIKDGMDAQQAFAYLSEVFKNQTSIQAETFGGKMARLKIAMDEAMESLGAALMPTAIKFVNWLTAEGIPWIERTAASVKAWWEEQDELREHIKGAGEQVQEFIEDVKTLIEWIRDAVEWVDRLGEKFKSLPGADFKGTDIPGVDTLAKKGLIDIIRGKASGGPVAGGTPYVVGEKGPELFVPGRSGTIIPNGGHVTSGQTVVLNIDGRSFMTWLVDYSNNVGGVPLALRN